MTGNDLLRRPHVFVPGSDAVPLLLLHGTGGDEHDLLPLGEHLAPGAPVLSPRGGVLENGMPRFFRRLREGVFDEDDLRERVAELTAFLAAAEAEHALPVGAWQAVGFSNGANIASALLFQRPQALAGAVLFAAMVPFRDGPGDVDLTGKRVAVVNGRQDPMATAEQTRTLVGQLASAAPTCWSCRTTGGTRFPSARCHGLRRSFAGRRRADGRLPEPVTSGPKSPKSWATTVPGRRTSRAYA